jgi:hypothetical protein
LSFFHNASNPEEGKHQVTIVLTYYKVKRIAGLKMSNVRFERNGHLRITDKLNRGEHVLAMTRALGHKVLVEYGVTGKPDIKSINLTKKDLFMVIMTDGI